jgi:hypothetical protein
MAVSGPTVFHRDRSEDKDVDATLVASPFAWLHKRGFLNERPIRAYFKAGV